MKTSSSPPMCTRRTLWVLIDCRGETALLVRFYRVNVKLGFPCGCRGFSSPFCLQASETVAVKFLLPSNPDLGSHRSFLGVAERRSEMQGGGGFPWNPSVSAEEKDGFRGIQTAVSMCRKLRGGMEEVGDGRSLHVCDWIC